jgi:hypothetical protein
MDRGTSRRLAASEPYFGSMKLQTGSVRRVVVRIEERYTSYFPIETIAR